MSCSQHVFTKNESRNLLDFFRLMSGSCHFDRLSNDEFSVKFWRFVIIMFFNCGWVWKLGAPSRYYKGPGCLNSKEIIFEWIRLLLDLILMSAEKNQNKHSKCDTKFVIWHPAKMTWSTHKSKDSVFIVNLKNCEFFEKMSWESGVMSLFIIIRQCK